MQEEKSFECGMPMVGSFFVRIFPNYMMDETHDSSYIAIERKFSVLSLLNLNMHYLSSRD